MKRTLALLVCLMSPLAGFAHPIKSSMSPASDEQHRMADLQNRLCADKDLSCSYVEALFADARLQLYNPPQPNTSSSAATGPRNHERNPYLTRRFGLLTDESLERCREYVAGHALAFDAAYKIYGVPKGIICGHLRIETDFGIPTGLSPHPLGTVPAINRLVTMYVRRPNGKITRSKFARRQSFALNELKCLLQAATKNSWDLFQIPGSPTGAIGLVQFEPSSFQVAVDGDGDGSIDLFSPDDAILSIAHYLTTRGWDSEPRHQQRAVYAYYGGHYDADPRKYYMKAVLTYAQEIDKYFRTHPIEPVLHLPAQPLPMLDDQTSNSPPREPSGN